MKNKLLIALALTMITLGAIGYSYACTNGGWHINCYCNCNVRFARVTTSDNEIEKDVANVIATINCAGDTINAYISNGYPCYRAYINYTIKNTGCKPIHFIGLTIINPNPEALEIATTNHTCTWLQPCQTVTGTTTVHILEPAKQNWQYTFQIKTCVTCNTGAPRTIGFWKNQFTSCTCHCGASQIGQSTLEQYLDQISVQSPIYEFTGTRRQKFQQAYTILQPPIHSSMEAKLKSQLLALWLNQVSGWAGGYMVDGKTASDIIQGSENTLLNHQTTQYEYWKNLCDTFNNLGG